MPVDLKEWAVAEAPKDAKPSVTLASDAAKCRRYLEIIKELKDLDAEKKILDKDLQPSAHSALVEQSRTGGKVLSSVAVNGILTYVATKSYTAPVSEATMAKVREAVGEKADGFFTEHYSLELTAEHLGDEEIVTVLKAKGLRPKVRYVPNDSFAAARIMDEDVAQVAATLRIVPKQYLMAKRGKKS